MFKLIFRLAVIFLIHFVLFAAYPDTGKYGNLYLLVSLFCWCVLFFGINRLSLTGSVIKNLICSVLVLFCYGIAIATTAYFMPQSDKVSVYDKVSKGQFPDWKTLKRGLTRFGLDTEEITDKATDAIQKKTEEKVNEMLKKGSDGSKPQDVRQNPPKNNLEKSVKEGAEQFVKEAENIANLMVQSVNP